MFHKNFKKFPWLPAAATACLILLLSLSCNDSVFDPDRLITGAPLSFFPPAGGEHWTYSFYNHSFYSSTDKSSNTGTFEHNYDGLFVVEVIKDSIINTEQRNARFYNLTISFQIEKEYYSCTNPEFLAVEDTIQLSDTSYTNLNFTLSFEYDLLFENDTLWIVENAPGFDRMDQGERTLLAFYSLFSPLSSRSGLVSLMILTYPGKDPFKGFKKNVGYNKGGGSRSNNYYEYYERSADYENAPSSWNHRVIFEFIEKRP